MWMYSRHFTLNYYTRCASFWTYDLLSGSPMGGVWPFVIKKTMICGPLWISASLGCVNDCSGGEAREQCVDRVLKDMTEEGWWRWVEDKKRQNERQRCRVVGRRSESTGDRDERRLTAVLLHLTSTVHHGSSWVNTKKKKKKQAKWREGGS